MHLMARVRNYLFTIAGILFAGMGIKGFLLTNKLIDGGVTGTSMLVSRITNCPISILIFVINVPFLFLGYKQLGKAFALRSAFAIAYLSLCLEYLNFPEVTHDKSLASVFGGIFLGTGVGLALRGDVVLDGTEIVALSISKKLPLLKVSDVILLSNLIIFSTAVFFLGIEPALYSILTYLSASKMVEFILNGIEQFSGLTVISAKGDKIRIAITNRGRGVTVYQGKGGNGKDGHINDPRDIVYTVATRLEITSIKREILELDPSAFIVQHRVEDITGGLVKKKSKHRH
jgi:uncharacterized membrane-anchored protein YitT (DUF2179 family)